MDLSCYMPTRVITGAHVVKENAVALLLGRHALIVTGKNSAKKSGALADVTEVLAAHGVGYTLFDKITENPQIVTCHEGGCVAREAGADFVIGIGGGSALDAAKAIAGFAVCPHTAPEDIYEDVPADGMLPIVAIPTTAGTGSEANPYAVLTLVDGLEKKTFKPTPGGYPRVSFVDPRYTYSLNEAYTVSTALDAFCHAIESYLSPRGNAVSDMFSLFAGQHIWDVLLLGADGEGEKDEGGFTPRQRERLSLAALAAGEAINITGTGFPHPLGYSITLSEGIPHGRACAVFTGIYVEKNLQTPVGKERLIRFADALGTTPEEIACRIPVKADVHLTLTGEQIVEHVDRVRDAGGHKNAPYVLPYEEMLAIYGMLFGASHTEL